ncbi:MAG: type I glutamate--ammonia ligase [Nitrososphaeria archaeon]
MPYVVENGAKRPRTISVQDVLSSLRTVKFVNMQFVDVRGKLQHFTVPSYEISESSLREGFPKIDGSSIVGFTSIDDSDLVFLPDPSTYAVIPWKPEEARMIGGVLYRMGSRRLETDTRHVAEMVQEHLSEQGLTAFFGPEVEFFVFDDVKFSASSGSMQYYEVISAESPSSESPLKMREKEGYYPEAPVDTLSDFRSRVSEHLLSFGYVPIIHHHEVAPLGQVEINFEKDTLIGAADGIVTLKYVATNVARSMGKYATFMPKPVFGENGSGMHVHVSLWEGSGYIAKRNLFYDPADEYAELSQTGRYFVGGLLEHSRSLAAIVAPSTNSYKRLVPGYEAPTFIAWSRGNRSANVRIPIYRRGRPEEKRVEFRTPDPSCNPYLALSAVLLAGLDGIRRKVEPGMPVDRNLYELDERELVELGVRRLPGSLMEALEELKSDSQYLKPFFSDALLERYIEIKTKEFREVEARPHPYEFKLYFDF